MSQHKSLWLTAISLLVLCLNSCTQESVQQTPVLGEKYEACCGVEPVEYTIGDARIYVPNVFTPNGDGINDLFYPFINDKIDHIDYFVILTPVGDTVIFNRPEFNYDNLENYAWTGYRSAGKNHEGLFKYDIHVITSKGEAVHLIGYACAIACGQDAQGFQTKTGCYFPAQAGAAGTLDTSQPSKESDCFH